MDLADALEEALGGNDEQQGVTTWLDTGFPPLNKVISNSYRGGMPAGRMIEMFGPPSSGKTAIATSVLVAAQKMGGIGIFMDHEESFDVNLAKGFGLDTTLGRWVYKQPDTFEESVDGVIKFVKLIRAKKLIAPEAPIAVVFDSLASMIPQSKFEDNKGKERETSSYGMHDNTALARCTSATFPVLSKMASKMNMILIFLNQEREKPGVAYGDPKTTPGGKAPEFYSSVRIQLGRELIRDKTDKQVVLGQDIKAFTKKNKVSAPFKRCSWRFMFQPDGTGKFDVAYSLLEHMKEVGAVTVAGAYIEWTDGKKYYIGQLAEKVEAEGLIEECICMLEAHEAATS